MEQLILHLKSHFPFLSQEALTKIESSFSYTEKKKGDILLKSGQVCKNLFFISEGICRYFAIKEGKDISTWFGFENEFVTSFTSFFPKKPSYESIELLTDSILYKIDFQSYQDMIKSSIELERVTYFFITLYTMQLEERLNVMQTKNAMEKYEHILEKHPHIIQQIPNKHLASYLGITRETLSRVRAKIH